MDVLGQIFFPENSLALFVDLVALGVEHVVVLEQVLAHVEVGSFDASLGLLDQAADQVHRHRHRIVDAHALHQVRHLRAAKAAHQVILEGEVEARGPWVALACGAAPQLIVDAPRLVPLGAHDVQPAQGPHTSLFLHVSAEEADLGRVDAKFVGGQRLQHAQALSVSQIVRVFRAAAAQHAVDRRQHFLREVPAQLDVDPASGHVGGDGYRPEGAGGGNDLGFLGVAFGIQYLVGDAAGEDLQQARPGFWRQLHKAHQPIDILRRLRIERKLQFARRRTQSRRGERRQGLIEEFQGLDQTTVLLRLMALEPGIPQQQAEREAAQRFGTQPLGEHLRAFHRGRADQYRPTQRVHLQDLGANGTQLGFLGAKDNVRVIFSSPVDWRGGIVFVRKVEEAVAVFLVRHLLQRALRQGGGLLEVGGDGHHLQLVDLAELLGLGQGRAGHAGQLRIQAEVVLQRDGGVGDVLSLDL